MPATSEEGARSESSRTTDAQLEQIRRRLAWIITALFLLVLVIVLNTAAVFGVIVDFHAGEGILIGSACGSSVVLGFIFGWLARRAAGH